MRINGYRCDGCGKEHLLEPYYRPQTHGDGLPEEWFMLTKPKLAAIEQPRFFCALACMHQWGQSPEGRIHRLEAEDKKLKTSQRCLTLILRCDLLIGGDRSGYIHARGRTVYELFSEKFPEAEELDETILDSNGTSIEELDETILDSNGTSFVDWRYTLDDAYDEHIEWARLAKEFGLIDHYVVDEVPA